MKTLITRSVSFIQQELFDRQKMDSTEKQLAEMLRDLKSRSKAKVMLESGLYVLILLFLFLETP